MKRSEVLAYMAGRYSMLRDVLSIIADARTPAEAVELIDAAQEAFAEELAAVKHGQVTELEVDAALKRIERNSM